jgi:hypothetical protein
MLLAGRLNVTVLMRYVTFLNLHNDFSHTSNRGAYQKIFPGGKVQLTSNADNLTAVSQLSMKCGIFDTSQAYRPPQPLQG